MEYILVITSNLPKKSESQKIVKKKFLSNGLSNSLILFRYITICAPFFYLRHNIKAWYYIVPIVLFATSYNIPRFFELRTFQATRYYCKNGTTDLSVQQELFDYVIENNLTDRFKCWNQTKYILDTTNFRTNPLYVQVGEVFFMSITITSPDKRLCSHMCQHSKVINETRGPRFSGTKGALNIGLGLYLSLWFLETNF